MSAKWHFFNFTEKGTKHSLCNTAVFLPTEVRCENHLLKNDSHVCLVPKCKGERRKLNRGFQVQIYRCWVTTGSGAGAEWCRTLLLSPDLLRLPFSPVCRSLWVHIQVNMLLSQSADGKKILKVLLSNKTILWKNSVLIAKVRTFHNRCDASCHTPGEDVWKALK